MPSSRPSRYEQVSRRAMLKTSLGVGAAALVPGLACGNADAETFAGAVAETTTTEATTTTAAPTTTEAPATTEGDTSDNTEGETTEPSDPTTEAAVAGELVVEFTYTQGAGGLNERPYIAVWVEDSAGDLAATISLWYELGRRGERWLDHLGEWFDADASRVAAGLPSDADTVSSATRAAGSYAVAWDGTIDSQPAAAGDYTICIEAAREEGPHSLICQPVTLVGTLETLAIPDEGELSGVSVRIDV